MSADVIDVFTFFFLLSTVLFFIWQKDMDGVGVVERQRLDFSYTLSWALLGLSRFFSFFEDSFFSFMG